MDSKPFLGGKYVGPVQVTTGEVETFTAREAGSDRPVYVHQISGTALPAQAALLKLLLSCLYRSPTVKEHVLDVREEGDVCYVVTQSAPQCLLLGEWLQFESERSDPGIKPVRAPTKPEEPRRKPDESPAVIAPPIPQEIRPYGVQRPEPISSHPQQPRAPFQASVQEPAIPVQKPAVPPLPPVPAPGEFTRLFRAEEQNLPRKNEPPEEVQRPSSASSPAVSVPATGVSPSDRARGNREPALPALGSSHR